jgi:hypothetical protein
MRPAPQASLRAPLAWAGRSRVRLVVVFAGKPQDDVNAPQVVTEFIGGVDNSVGRLWGICEIKSNLCTRKSQYYEFSACPFSCLAPRFLATRKRRIVGKREWLPVQGPPGPGIGGTSPRGKRRTGELRSCYRGRGSAAAAGYGSGLVPLPARRVRPACAPPYSSARNAALSLRGSGAPVRVGGVSRSRSSPASASGASGVLAFVLAKPPAPGAGAEGFGCRLARIRRAGTRFR